MGFLETRREAPVVPVAPWEKHEGECAVLQGWLIPSEGLLGWGLQMGAKGAVGTRSKHNERKHFSYMPILGKCFYFSATQYCQLAVSEPGLPRLEVQQEPGSLQPVNPSSIRTTCRHITGVWGGSLPGISDSEGLGTQSQT